MKTQTENSIEILVNIFELQTRLFKNVLAGIKNEDASERINEKVNHIAWLAGHLVSARYMIAGLVGLQEQEPYPDIFGHGKGIQEVEYPAIEELVKDWQPISEKLLNRLKTISDEELSAKSPIQVPIGDASLKGTITFFAHHEAYHIGQIGILRKYVGKDAMEYK